MSCPPASRRPLSSEEHQWRNESEATRPALLRRTPSQVPSVIESVAVHDVPPDDSKPASPHNRSPSIAVAWPRSVRFQILLCAFLTSLSFGVTQVPILYVFRLMTCDAYYQDHPDDVPDTFTHTTSSIRASRSVLLYGLDSLGYHVSDNVNLAFDRCSIHPVESSTALAISVLGASTTVFGLLNLFITSSLIKKIGVKRTLLIQVFFPALRLLIQNVGVEVWGSLGMVIFQLSQIVSILGGPSGYLLALNTYMTEVVEHEGRTAALGRVTGSMMFGTALGFLGGGIVADVLGIKSPFRLTLALFLVSSLYVLVFLPYIPPSGATATSSASSATSKRQGIRKFLGPLVVFTPRRAIRRDGTIQTEYGAFLLAIGVFLGVLATGYIPTLLQLYATDVFGFGTTNNGWVIFIYSILRGVFLTFAFPWLIAKGRKIVTKREEKARLTTATGDSIPPERKPLLTQKIKSVPAINTRPSDASETTEEPTFTFDLVYTRFSLVVDGILTLSCSCVRQGWQMYLVAAVLPFGAGTGSASKGTILQMVGSSATSAERSDALAGVSLVENMARLTTAFVFGVVFAAFASIGRTELVFVFNAATALVGFAVVLSARFPPEGSRWLDKEEEVAEASHT